MQKSCFIIPCYNEAERLLMMEFREFVSQNEKIDFYFVNDGSTDATLSILEQLKDLIPTRINILNLSHNKGKAEAVRSGVLNLCVHNNYDFIGFLDADLATPLSQLNLFLNHKEKQFIMGSRIKRMGSKIKRSPSRHYLGRIFSTCASLILRLPVYDTQCGAKLISKKLAEQIFSKQFVTQWLFDIELLARIIGVTGRKKACELIYEVPLLNWEEKTGSKLKLKHLLKVPFELLKIKTHYRNELNE